MRFHFLLKFVEHLVLLYVNFKDDVKVCVGKGIASVSPSKDGMSSVGSTSVKIVWPTLKEFELENKEEKKEELNETKVDVV